MSTGCEGAPDDGLNLISKVWVNATCCALHGTVTQVRLAPDLFALCESEREAGGVDYETLAERHGWRYVADDSLAPMAMEVDVQPLQEKN
jgi:hypothetical protein